MVDIIKLSIDGNVKYELLQIFHNVVEHGVSLKHKQLNYWQCQSKILNSQLISEINESENVKSVNKHSNLLLQSTWNTRVTKMRTENGGTKGHEGDTHVIQL